jgi:hypothetical protein
MLGRVSQSNCGEIITKYLRTSLQGVPLVGSTTGRMNATVGTIRPEQGLAGYDGVG